MPSCVNRQEGKRRVGRRLYCSRCGSRNVDTPTCGNTPSIIARRCQPNHGPVCNCGGNGVQSFDCLDDKPQ
jgi:hypothetical protein